MKIIFRDYAAELIKDEQKELITKLKSKKYSHLIFTCCYPYCIDLELS